MKLKFYFEQRVYADSTAVWLIGEKSDGTRYMAKPMDLIFEPLDDYRNQSPSPSFEFTGVLSREFFPALAAGLAEAGYKQESSDAGELKATKAHLADMQKLVFK